MKKLLLAAFLTFVTSTRQAQAGQYYQLDQTSSSATLRVAGLVNVASSTNPYTPVITVDGATGLFTSPNSSFTYGVRLSTAIFTPIVQPATPVEGMLYYDNTSKELSLRQNGVWVNIATGTTGGNGGGIMSITGDISVTGTSAVTAKVSSATTGTFTLSAGSTVSAGGVLIFSTAASAATTGVPALFIDNSGNVGISTSAGLGPLPGKFYVDGQDPNADAIVADFNNSKVAFLARKGDTKLTYFKADINGIGFGAQAKGNSLQSTTCTSPLFADSANNGLCSDASIIGLATNGTARLSVANAGAVTVTSSFTVAAASASVAFNFTATTGTFTGTGGYSLFAASGAWIQDGVLKVKGIEFSDLSVSTTGRSGTAGGGGGSGASLTSTNTWSASQLFTSSVSVGSLVLNSTANWTNGVYNNGWTIIASTLVTNATNITFSGLRTKKTYWVVVNVTNGSSAQYRMNTNQTASFYYYSANCRNTVNADLTALSANYFALDAEADLATYPHQIEFKFKQPSASFDTFVGLSSYYKVAGSGIIDNCVIGGNTVGSVEFTWMNIYPTAGNMTGYAYVMVLGTPNE